MLKFRVKFKKLFQNGFRSFKMRKMSDVFKFDNIVLMRHNLAKSFDQMFARNLVSQAVDKAKRLFHSLAVRRPNARDTLRVRSYNESICARFVFRR